MQHEVVEVIDNKTGRILFTLVFNPKTQDYTLVSGEGLTFPSVNVYTRKDS